MEAGNSGKEGAAKPEKEAGKPAGEKPAEEAGKPAKPAEEAGKPAKEPAKPAKEEAAKPEKEAAKSSKEEAKPAKEGAKPSPRPEDRRTLIRVGIAVVLVIGLIVWLATRDSGSDNSGTSSSTTTPAQTAPPRIVTPAELRLASTPDHPVYWVGTVPGTELELSELPAGGIRVRYLPQGAAAGAGTPKNLSVGTYPLDDPTASLQGYAQQPDAIVRHSGDGREIVTSSGRPTSVYFVDPDNTVQVEVYDPSPRLAMSLALSGVHPAG